MPWPLSDRKQSSFHCQRTAEDLFVAVCIPHASQLQLSFGLPSFAPACPGKVAVSLPDSLLILIFTFPTLCLHSLLTGSCLTSCTQNEKRLRNGVEETVPKEQPALLGPSPSEQPPIGYLLPAPWTSWCLLSRSPRGSSTFSFPFPDKFKHHHLTAAAAKAVTSYCIPDPFFLILAELLCLSVCPAPVSKDWEATIRGGGCSSQAMHNVTIQDICRYLTVSVKMKWADSQKAQLKISALVLFFSHKARTTNCLEHRGSNPRNFQGTASSVTSREDRGTSSNQLNS